MAERQVRVAMTETDWRSILAILDAAEEKEFIEENMEVGDEIAALREKIAQQL